MPKKLTNESFDLKNTSGYTRIGNYINSKAKIAFLCPSCNNTWDTTPDRILRGHGCFDCSYTIRSSTVPITQEQFVQKLDNIPYTLVGKYIGTMYKTLFKCNSCNNEWETRPNDILNGHGCPECALTGYKKDRLGYLYFIQVGSFLKVGITNRLPALRYKEITKDLSITEIKVLSGDGNLIYQLEQFIHKIFPHYDTKVLKSGNTECFPISLKEEILRVLDNYPIH